MKKLLLMLVCVVMVLALGCTPVSYAPSNTPDDIQEPEPQDDAPVVKLSDDIINAAVAECADRTNWGINLGKVRINYVTGTKVQAAIILHNGDDCERLVVVNYQPIYKTKIDYDTGLSYEPAPIEASGWVSVDTSGIRLDKMQTEVVPVYLLVPNGYEGLPDRWEFQVRAVGLPIKQYQYTVLVTTVENDTVLEQHLPQPLLQNSLASIIDIISTIDEVPYATRYDPESGVLTIEGLKESMIRELTIIFEYGEQVAIGYSQRWLITML